MDVAKAIKYLPLGVVVDVTDPEDVAALSHFAAWRWGRQWKWAGKTRPAYGCPAVTGYGGPYARPDCNGLAVIPLREMTQEQLGKAAVQPYKANGVLARAILSAYVNLSPGNNSHMAGWIRDKARVVWDRAADYAAIVDMG